MSIKQFCDACGLESNVVDRFEFRGHTNDDFHMDYWHADLCFNCQFKMRESVNIHDKKKDLRLCNI